MEDIIQVIALRRLLSVMWNKAIAIHATHYIMTVLQERKLPHQIFLRRARFLATGKRLEITNFYGYHVVSYVYIPLE